jgi:hypothetical protein
MESCSVLRHLACANVRAVVRCARERQRSRRGLSSRAPLTRRFGRLSRYPRVQLEVADQPDIVWLELVEVVVDLRPSSKPTAAAQIEAHRGAAGCRRDIDGAGSVALFSINRRRCERRFNRIPRWHAKVDRRRPRSPGWRRSGTSSSRRCGSSARSSTAPTNSIASLDRA